MESETKRERGMMLRVGLASRNHLGVGMLPLSRIEEGSQAEAVHPKVEHPGVPPGEPGARGGEKREQEASEDLGSEEEGSDGDKQAGAQQAVIDTELGG